MSAVSAPPNSPQASTSRGHARRISFVTYCRIAWIDYLCIAVIAGLTLGVYFTPMYLFNHRVIPILPSITPSTMTEPPWMLAFYLPREITYPWMSEPLPTWGCALVVVFVPLLVIAIFQLKTRGFWDFHARVVGVLKAVVSAYVCNFSCAFRINISTTNTDKPGIRRSFVCAILKHFVGGFRPYYIEACKPNWTSIVRDLHKGIYRFNATACTGNRRDVDRAYVWVFLRPLLRSQAAMLPVHSQLQSSFRFTYTQS
jgi:diacylglycerol diphosphate phosphatase/phosphatidate phosphatase